jgi:hypothetical protein
MSLVDCCKTLSLWHLLHCFMQHNDKFWTKKY